MLTFFAESKDILSVLSSSIEQGLSLQRFLADLDLPTDLLDSPNARVPMEACWRIINAHLNITQEETHLMSSRPLKRGTTKLIYSHLVHCSTLREGLELLAETYNVVHGGNYNFVRKRGSKLSYVVDDKGFPYVGEPNSFMIEVALANIHCALSFLTDYELRLNGMCTKRDAEVAKDHFLNLFHCRLTYGHGFYELTYDASQAELPFKNTHSLDLSTQIYTRYLDQLPQKPPLMGEQAWLKSVEQKILAGDFHQQSIAESLGMSVATLRRRLDLAGTNFREVLDRILASMAFDYLDNGLSPEDIAEKLGYSDLRSFRRAFKRWYGDSPAAYIRDHLVVRESI